MIGRLLVATLLLHHVEGVCKPLSTATQAARAASAYAAKVRAALLAESRQERLERATGRRQLDRAARVGLPRGGRQVDALPLVVEGEVIAVEVER